MIYANDVRLAVLQSEKTPIAVVFSPQALADLRTENPEQWFTEVSGIPAYVCGSEKYGAFIFSEPYKWDAYKITHAVKPVTEPVRARAV